MTASRPEGAPARLSHRIAAALPALGEPALRGASGTVPLRALATRGFVAAPADAVCGRNVLIRTHDPLSAAAALASLDGVAARLILCPPDLDPDHIEIIAKTAAADIIVGDVEAEGVALGLPAYRIGLDGDGVGPAIGGEPRASQWALFTSGTSGAPKMVVHSLAALTGAIAATGDGPRPVWATFYDIRRYGGLQMLLRALTGGCDLLLGGAQEPLADVLGRLRAHGATHVTGTPSHWRRALMSPALHGLDPQYVRLSGEIADQSVLDSLRTRFPHARIGHAYASTEAGVGFEVTDGQAGFPASLVDRDDGPVRLRIEDGELLIRSDRTAEAYLGAGERALLDAEGWVATGDLVERRGDRVFFLGRRSGVINVGGLKISPEEVEAVINAAPGVRMSRVAARANPLLGALVAAEVVLSDPDAASEARGAILAHCRTRLPPHKTPASIRFVAALDVSPAGKLERRRA